MTEKYRFQAPALKILIQYRHTLELLQIQV